jgi:hypothetical protein
LGLRNATLIRVLSHIIVAKVVCECELAEGSIILASTRAVVSIGLGRGVEEGAAGAVLLDKVGRRALEGVGHAAGARVLILARGATEGVAEAGTLLGGKVLGVGQVLARTLVVGLAEAVDEVFAVTLSRRAHSCVASGCLRHQASHVVANAASAVLDRGSLVDAGALGGVNGEALVCDLRFKRGA